MKTEHIEALAAQLRQSQQSLLGRMAQQREGASTRVETNLDYTGEP